MPVLHFWVLSLCHQDSHAVRSVYINISTLMLHHGHMLQDHEQLSDCEIEQKYVQFFKNKETVDLTNVPYVYQVEWYNKAEGKYQRDYIGDLADLPDLLTYIKAQGDGEPPFIQTFAVIYD